MQWYRFFRFYFLVCILHFKRTLTVRKQNPSEQELLLYPAYSLENIPHLVITQKKLLHEAQIIFLKGCKGSKQISKLLISNVGDYLPPAPKFLKSQSNQSLIFCELICTLPTWKGMFMVSQNTEGVSDQKSGRELSKSQEKPFLFHTFMFQPQVLSQKTYFWRRWPRQDSCTAHPWKWEVPHGALGCKSFNWGRYKTKNALKKVGRKELNMPAE